MNQATLDGFHAPTKARCYDKVQSQGQQAVRTGAAAEATIYCILKVRGLSVEKQKFVGTNIYGGEIRCDFAIAPCEKFPGGLIIESKWQETPGSADEKLPYLVENIRTRYPYPCIVILDGDGYRPGAAAWIRTQVDGVNLLGVFSFTEFLKWCNSTL